ncbi:MAG: Hsp20/alpha crystallin family protein [Bacteroidia bacterium]|nr:Hsp20/alpha crystallin family protein [Bacteroidia bacterium]
MKKRTKNMFGYWRGDYPQKRGGRGRGFRRAKYNVPVNIVENDTEFELWVYAFNFPKENIKVSVLEDTLYITGSRTPENEHPNWLLHEFPIKSFERTFELSHRVDKAGIRAVHQDGILKVFVAKTGAAQKPEMTVEVE